MAGAGVISKFRGAMVGAVIGDCLGAHFEGHPHIQIPMRSVIQHFDAVKTRQQEQEGKGDVVYIVAGQLRVVWVTCGNSACGMLKVICGMTLRNYSTHNHSFNPNPSP